MDETASPLELDWRKSGSPDDLLSALDSQYSYDSFIGRAAIYMPGEVFTPLKIDLFIRNLDMRFEDHIQLTDYIGDYFGATCFGKAPMLLTFSAVLADSPTTYGKQHLVDAWKNKLRLGAVAKTGKIPFLIFENCAIQGPFIKMQLNETAESQDTLIAVLTMIVTALQVSGANEQLFFDYIHGVESDNPMSFLGELGKPKETPKAEQIKDPDVQIKSIKNAVG